MLMDLSIPELSKLLVARKISSVDLVKESYKRITAWDGQLNSFISLKDKKIAIREANILDKNRTKNSGALYGLVFSMKDAYLALGTKTTCASNMLKNFKSPYSSTVYQKLKSAGAILIGKNNLDSWGHGGSTENSDFGVSKNPWDQKRVAGGSSGGSAIAVASRMVNFAIGEDTGGSIRNPSSMCNISGLKVSYGRVSRWGTIAYASSLDTVGPMAKSSEDLAYVLQEMAGADKKDASSAQKKLDDYISNLKKRIKGKKIGLAKEFFSKNIDPEIEKIVRKVAERLTRLGAEIVNVSIPHLNYGISIYYLIALSETSSNMARYDGVRYGNKRESLSPETIKRIILGTYALSAGYADKLYKKAQKARTVLIDEYRRVFKKCDVLLAPVTPSKPAKIGELINDPVKNFLEDLYTVTVNVAGLPSLAIPAGFTKDNLPIGVQLIGERFHEAELLNIGYKYQQNFRDYKKIPTTIKN